MSQINNKTILKPPNQTIYFVKKISKIKSNFITQKDNKPINQRINWISKNKFKLQEVLLKDNRICHKFKMEVLMN